MSFFSNRRICVYKYDNTTVRSTKILDVNEHLEHHIFCVIISLIFVFICVPHLPGQIDWKMFSSNPSSSSKLFTKNALSLAGMDAIPFTSLTSVNPIPMA